MALTIVGLGPGSADDLTRAAWQTLENAQGVYLRTSRHPCVPQLPAGPDYRSFDDLYETADNFEAVYAAITARILEAAATGDVVYAVPGDPFVGESTTARILASGIPARVIHGISFVEPTLKLVGADAMDGLQILDALTVAAMHHPPINPDAPALLGQVYNRQVASDVKLTLMNQYPDDFRVSLVHAAGTPQAHMETLPLFEIDHSPHINHLTSLYLPPLGDMSSYEQFQEIIAHLRAPEGCPWDRKQTHDSLRPYLIEEAYEVLEAIENGDTDGLYEELGDVLLQVVLHTQIAIDDGEFRMADVLRAINHKMIRRHPHVWGDASADTPEQVKLNWDQLKQNEKASGSANGKPRESVLDGVPVGLPALMQGETYQRKAAKVGFDWVQIDEVLAKLMEEIREVQDAPTPEERRKEIGDVLFSVINWARWLGLEDVEGALREANARFGRRFRYVEQAVAASGRPYSAYTVAELDVFWAQAKAQGL